MCGVSVPLCPQIDRYLKDKTLTRRWLSSKAQLMSTTVCRPSKTNSVRGFRKGDVFFSFLFFFFYFTLLCLHRAKRYETNVRSFVGIEKRKGEREKKKREINGDIKAGA